MAKRTAGVSLEASVGMALFSKNQRARTDFEIDKHAGLGF